MASDPIPSRLAAVVPANRPGEARRGRRYPPLCKAVLGRPRRVAICQRQKLLVILFGSPRGPSHIDTWDPKPDAPGDVCGPFWDDRHQGPRTPSVRALAAAGQYHGPADLDPLRGLPGRRDHHPATMQSGNTLSQSPTFADGGRQPVDGLARREAPRGPNQPGMPAFVWRGGCGESPGRPTKVQRRPSGPRLPAGRRRRVRRGASRHPRGSTSPAHDRAALASTPTAWRVRWMPATPWLAWTSTHVKRYQWSFQVKAAASLPDRPGTGRGPESLRP